MLLFFHFLVLLTIQSQSLQTVADTYSPTQGPYQEYLLCRKCGADIIDSYYLFTKISPGGRKSKKQNIFGKQNVTVQTLVNPFGIEFDVITAEKVRCNNVGPRQSAESWFPGYSWRVCTCPYCGAHLGWTFEHSTAKNSSPEKPLPLSFHGIILSRILGENFTDSLIMMPTTYKM